MSTKKPQRTKPSSKVSHFSWPDLLVLAGAAILVPVALYERRWFFLVIGLTIAAALGIRVLVTRALASRVEAPRGSGATEEPKGPRDRAGRE